MRGILPNQLRIILKEENPNTADIAFEDISKELFWHGYKIWLTRNRRVKDFWKDVAPDNWKPHWKEIKNSKKQHEAKIAEQCTSPFHFLRRNKDLSKQRPTMCYCSRIEKQNTYKYKDISTFFTHGNHNFVSHSFETKLRSLPFKKKKAYDTREDRIRGARSSQTFTLIFL